MFVSKLAVTLDMLPASQIIAPVLNKAELPPTIHFKMPDELLTGVVFVGCCCIVGNELEEVPDATQYRPIGTCWVNIPTSVLKTDVGFHKYQFEFVDCVTLDTLHLYCAYTIQDDNPEKPYIYMNEET